MQIAVFGAGGVGGYFGGRLAKAGEQVLFLARGEHLAAIQRDGLQVESIDGDFTINPAQATDNLDSLKSAGVVLLGVKAWQVQQVAGALSQVLNDQACVLPLQNGVDAPAQLTNVLGQGRVLGGLCQISAYKAGPGLIRHAGIRPKIIFAELDGTPSERVAYLRRAFERAEVLVETPSDIWPAVWRKFLFITAASGLGAVTRAPLGVIRSLPETRRMLVEAMQEVAALAWHRNIALDAGIVNQTLASIDGMHPDVIPSMQRDIMEGRPSELESQNGAVVRMGKESGIPTPIHEYIYASLLPQENLARRQHPT